MRQRDKDPFWDKSPSVIEHEKNDGSADEEREDDWLHTIQELLEDKGIYLPKCDQESCLVECVRMRVVRYRPGPQRILCPKCQGGSTKEVSFTVTIDETAQV